MAGRVVSAPREPWAFLVLLLSGVAWSQDLSTAPAHVSLLLQTNVAVQEKMPVAFSVKRAEIVLSGRVAPPLHWQVVW